MGVDSFYLAQKFDTLDYVEENAKLAQIVQYNFRLLHQHNIVIRPASAENFLLQNKQKFDLIFIDPDRRPNVKRVISFKDSKPYLIELLPGLFNISSNLLVKASLMMDISIGINQLNKVKMVIILAIGNEVKELLFWLSSKNQNKPKIRCVNLGREYDQVLEYRLSDDQQEYCSYSGVSNYLYEPNGSIMKAGAYNLLCKKFKLEKLHRNTHLYTSDSLANNFPGRKFKVNGQTAYKKQKVLSMLNSDKANISVRNFIDTPEQVKQKLGLKGGGQQYLFGYRDLNEQLRIAVCEKI